MAEAREQGLTYREWMAVRKELGFGPSKPKRKQPSPPKVRQPVGPTLSDAARQLLEAERRADAARIAVRPPIPCPKIRFDTLVLARSALRRMLDDPTYPDDFLDGLDAYACTRCAGAHLGHSNY